MSDAKFRKITPADFFYRNRDMAGFDNPTRALYTAFRELVENSLDACEDGRILPELFINLRPTDQSDVYTLYISDNGTGVPQKHIKPAFGQILYGSKYMHKQARGRFGLEERWLFYMAKSQQTNPFGLYPRLRIIRQSMM